MSNDTLETTIKSLLETQIIQALNSAPEAIEKMVKAALAKPVDANGYHEGQSSYSGYRGTMPYLDWMVGNEIRDAARNAAKKVIQQQMPDIEAEVRKGLSSESIVAAITKSLVGTAEQEWRINVSFEAEKNSR